MNQKVFILSDHCAVIEWYQGEELIAIWVTDLRHTHAAGGPITVEIDENLQPRRVDS